MTTLEKFVSSLTGETIDMENFNTINIFNNFNDTKLSPSFNGDLPINKSKLNRSTELNGTNQFSTKKVETEPFFKPTNNVSNVRAQNPFSNNTMEQKMEQNKLYKNREFYENRQNSLQSNFRNNELPFNQTKVGKARTFDINKYLNLDMNTNSTNTPIPTEEGFKIVQEFFENIENKNNNNTTVSEYFKRFKQPKFRTFFASIFQCSW